MDGMRDSASPDWKYGVAGLVGPLGDPKPLADELEHLRHERQTIDLSFFVESGKNLGLALDLHPVAGFQLQITSHLLNPVLAAAAAAARRSARLTDGGRHRHALWRRGLRGRHRKRPRSVRLVVAAVAP